MLSVVEGNQQLFLPQNCLYSSWYSILLNNWWFLRYLIHTLILWTLKVLIKVLYSMHLEVGQSSLILYTLFFKDLFQYCVPIYAKFSLVVSYIIYSAIAEITFASFLVTTISKTIMLAHRMQGHTFQDIDNLCVWNVCCHMVQNICFLICCIKI